MGCIESKTIPLKSLKKLSIFEINTDELKRQSFANICKYCKFDHIYDGDTADIFFLHNGEVVRHAFRFYGYDSAEMKLPKNTLDRDTLKQKALDDKKFLSEIITNAHCVVKFMENEKYGRMMGEVWLVSDISVPEELLAHHPELTEKNKISNIMILNNHGVPYFGGSKQ